MEKNILIEFHEEFQTLWNYLQEHNDMTDEVIIDQMKIVIQFHRNILLEKQLKIEEERNSLIKIGFCIDGKNPVGLEAIAMTLGFNTKSTVIDAINELKEKE